MVSFLELVNWLSIKFTKKLQGLIQDDSVSLIMFVIIEEGFRHLKERAQKERLVQGFQMGNEVVEIIHLQFVDGALLSL